MTKMPFDVNTLLGDLHGQNATHDPSRKGPSPASLSRGNGGAGDSHGPSPGSERDIFNHPPMEAISPAEDSTNPAHYRRHPSGIECIEVTRHMNFNTGNAIKYIWRYLDKGDPIENLKKAQWYLDDEIRRLQGLR